ncbi:MAG: hypothetical protein KDA75_04220 [Planctomycetaceae bacterium]|nr:hypothetical protein [Planctomycetaceae bacterium]
MSVYLTERGAERRHRIAGRERSGDGSPGTGDIQDVPVTGRATVNSFMFTN